MNYTYIQQVLEAGDVEVSLHICLGRCQTTVIEQNSERHRRDMRRNMRRTSNVAGHNESCPQDGIADCERDITTALVSCSELEYPILVLDNQSSSDHALLEGCEDTSSC